MNNDMKINPETNFKHCIGFQFWEPLRGALHLDKFYFYPPKNTELFIKTRNKMFELIFKWVNKSNYFLAKDLHRFTEAD